jgi:hypothetical protein
MYLHDWAKDGEVQMLRDFGITKDALEGIKVILASYTYEEYVGEAYVLFRKDGRLYEVHGSHCSCHGLASKDYRCDGNTQLEPEETTREAILHRIENGTWGKETGVAEYVMEVL